MLYLSLTRHVHMHEIWLLKALLFQLYLCEVSDIKTGCCGNDHVTMLQVGRK